MVERITREQLETVAEKVSAMLNVKIDVGYRYGYCAVDIYDKSGQRMLSTYQTGLTKNQALDLIRAMAFGADHKAGVF